jgi:hypothetical protein
MIANHQAERENESVDAVTAVKTGIAETPASAEITVVSAARVMNVTAGADHVIEAESVIVLGEGEIVLETGGTDPGDEENVRAAVTNAMIAEAGSGSAGEITTARAEITVTGIQAGLWGGRAGGKTHRSRERQRRRSRRCRQNLSLMLLQLKRKRNISDVSKSRWQRWVRMTTILRMKRRRQ